MPDAAAQQRYDINELESAAVFAVTEIERLAETVSQAAKADVTVHSPEATWGDPVRLAETVAGGAVLIPVSFNDRRTAVFFMDDDAALYAALLGGLSGDNVSKAVKGGIGRDAAQLLHDLVNQVFIPAGARVGDAVLLKAGQDVLAPLEQAVGASFLSVKVALSPTGYSEGHVWRLYDNAFVEANFRADAAKVGLDTQLMPSTSFERAVPSEDEGAVAKDAAAKAPAPARQPAASSIDRLKSIPVTLRVLLASRRIRLREAMNLLPGEVIEFGRKISEPSEVMVNSHVIAGAEVVRSGHHYGVMLRKIASVRERISSLKPS
ncbi:MAG TPA: hypothetical protein ENN09_01100 [Planctomycetes bacterium]|nr:hypothetical protein [Planctomycetota bacterium]